MLNQEALDNIYYELEERGVTLESILEAVNDDDKLSDFLSTLWLALALPRGRGLFLFTIFISSYLQNTCWPIRLSLWIPCRHNIV